MSVKMNTLIFSHLYHRPGSPQQDVASLHGLLAVWLDHLRGPGEYQGDVVLFTNVRGIGLPGLTTRPFVNVPADPRHAHLHRVLSYRDVPIEDYEVAMQMDLDLLAVDDINPLFPRDTRLWAARSDAGVLDWRHAWTLLPRWRRAIHKLSGWKMNEPGVSACVVASATSVWEQNFGTWARAISDHGDRPIPHLADQSFLNLLYLRGSVPMACWSNEWIRSRDWDSASGARLLHFPCSRRKYMLRYRKVGSIAPPVPV
jgi:hypothetical protein